VDDANLTMGFTCQHGPVECEGNRVQLCALAQYPQQATTRTSLASAGSLVGRSLSDEMVTGAERRNGYGCGAAIRTQDAFYPFVECFEKFFPATRDANVTLHACAECVRRLKQ
jgi:hypothetical protein